MASKDLFPGSFDFYQMGKVSPLAFGDTNTSLTAGTDLLPANLNQDGLRALAISITGEFRGIALFLFDERGEISLQKELANTLASQLADRLAARVAQGSGLVMISPPVRLSHTQYQALIEDFAENLQESSASSLLSQTYQYTDFSEKADAVPFSRARLILLSAPALDQHWEPNLAQTEGGRLSV